MVEITKDKKGKTWIVTTTDSEGFHRQINMTKDELDAKLQHSYDQSLRGEGRPFEDVFDD